MWLKPEGPATGKQLLTVDECSGYEVGEGPASRSDHIST